MDILKFFFKLIFTSFFFFFETLLRKEMEERRKKRKKYIQQFKDKDQKTEGYFFIFIFETIYY
jgi:hypothetical protein